LAGYREAVVDIGADRRYTVEATRNLLEKYSALEKKFVAVPNMAKTGLRSSA